MQNLEGWIGAQRQAIIANWKQWDVPPVVAIEGIHVLGSSYGGPEGRATRWLPLQTGSAASAVGAMIQRTEGGVMSLWIDPALDNYVDLFRTFLEQHAKVDHSDLSVRYDVDHLYNAARARNFGYKLVRLFPIPASINRSHGAGYEKAMTAADVGRRRKVMKLMDEVSTMKFFGIRSPRKNGKLSATQRQHLDKMATEFGLAPGAAVDGASGLMDRAHQRS